MKQALFITTIEADKPQGGVGLCQLRAATPGLANERMAALQAVARFAPPAGSDAEPLRPTRLALIRTPETGRCVLHSVLARPAPPGSFPGIDLPPVTDASVPTLPPRLGLTHALIDLPSMVDPQQVLFSWGSDQWQQHDVAANAELGEALFVPVSGQLGDEALTGFLKDTAGRELCEFLLAAYLSTAPESRIFLAAPPEHVALAVFALTKALPHSVLEHLTFSTYEPEPTLAKARIIGACWPAGTVRDLPPACYDGLGVAFNTFTGTKTGINLQMPFVQFATENLVSGKPTTLNEFHATWLRLGVRDLGLLDLVYRLSGRNGKLTKAEAERAMQDPALAAWVATHPGALPQLLNWALEDVDYATATFSRAVGALRQRPDLLNNLGTIVQNEGTAALKAGQLARTRNALEVVLPMVAPAKAASLWPDLFKQLAEPETLPWEMRGYLLPRLARLKPLPINQEADAQVRGWLTVPLENLPGLLNVELPESYHLTALSLAEGRDGASAPLAKALGSHTAFVIPLLSRMASKPNGETRALMLFEAVQTEAPRNWLDHLLRSGRSLPTSLLDRCVTSGLQHGNPDVRAVVRSHGPALLEQLAGQKSMDRLAAMLLEQPGTELLVDEPVGEFLEKLSGHPGLSETVWQRLDAFLAVRGYLRHPSLHPDSLKQVADGLTMQPPLFPPTVWDRLARSLTDSLTKATGDVQEDLEQVMLVLGPRYDGGPTALYRVLLRQIELGKILWKREDLLHAFVALAFDAAKADQVNAELNGLEPEAASLVQQIKRSGGAKMLQAIDGRTANWPRSARRQWVFLTQSASLSRGGLSPSREVILVLAGGAIATVLFAALRFLGYL